MHPPSFLSAYQARVNQALNTCLPHADAEPALLHQAMRYSVLGGGKRLRAALVYATGEALGANEEVLDQIAVAVELVHAYSLIHDDLPAMDDGKLRHGRLTCHRVYGDALAILAGDALQSLAFEQLTKPHRLLTPSQQLTMIKILAQAIGSLGMVGGQVLDITTSDNTNIAILENLHQKKTGALMTASVSLGALTGHYTDKKQPKSLSLFSSKLGLAFQIYDDILDVQASTESLGKVQGTDAIRGKLTYPCLLGLRVAKERMIQLYEESLACLRQADIHSPALVALAEFAIKREG